MHLNFFKAKQKIEETVSQPTKTQIMSADMSQIYKLLENMRVTFTETRKKLKDVITTVSEEGKQAKNFELVLSQTLLRESDKYPSESLLHKVLVMVGKVEATLSMENASYELRLDEEFRRPLIDIIENKLNVIDKAKKKLSKARFHLDACRARTRSTQKDSSSAQKVAQYETELDEATKDFDFTQDLFTTEVLNFIAQEKKYADLFISMLEASRDYHMAAFNTLERCLPDLRETAEITIYQPVYGLDLSKHREVFGQELSFVIMECCEYILNHGIEIEGIFRVAGSSNKTKKLRSEFDAGVANLTADAPDVHTVASCLKNYLRDLPDAILMNNYRNEYLEVLKMDPVTKVSALSDIIHRIPHSYYINLKYLMCFLRKISLRAEINKMNIQNIGIVIGPNLLWSNDPEKQLSVSNCATVICETLLANYERIFEESD